MQEMHSPVYTNQIIRGGPCCLVISVSRDGSGVAIRRETEDGNVVSIALFSGRCKVY
jgi:hypothetical protein